MRKIDPVCLPCEVAESVCMDKPERLDSKSLRQWFVFSAEDRNRKMITGYFVIRIYTCKFGLNLLYTKSIRNQLQYTSSVRIKSEGCPDSEILTKGPDLCFQILLGTANRAECSPYILYISICMSRISKIAYSGKRRLKEEAKIS